MNHLPKISNFQIKGEKLPLKLPSIDVLHHNTTFSRKTNVSKNRIHKKKGPTNPKAPTILNASVTNI